MRRSIGTYLAWPLGGSVTIDGETCVLTVMLDITERKQTETDLLKAIEAVMQDTSWFGQKMSRSLPASTRPGCPVDNPGASVARSTCDTREVVGFVARGLSDDEIATKIGIDACANTVRNHISADLYQPA